ncbi:MAG: class I SAM-dependent methyltransferase [Dehalococcoidales bacterium]|nr:class I SAM-dependent methyltransferase [Dehalococcoidales bacterium]
MARTDMDIDYGNWVSRKIIYVPGIISLIFFGLAYYSLFFMIGSIFFLMLAAYFLYAYRQFSPRGGNLQVRIRDQVFSHLPWDGDGRLLDIGCGNGALAIEAARKYPGAQVSGIDYWGGQWEYSRQACEKNAAIAGVSERTSFMKASASRLPFADASLDVSTSNMVFHEVRDAGDKKELIKEALRVVKKGGLFTFQDLFLLKSIYGDPDNLVRLIKSWGIREVHFVNTSELDFIPRLLKLPFMVGRIGIIYGRK